MRVVHRHALKRQAAATRIGNIHAGLMQRKIYTHNEADPAAWAE
jgi:hypothetical protein